MRRQFWERLLYGQQLLIDCAVGKRTCDITAQQQIAREAVDLHLHRGPRIGPVRGEGRDHIARRSSFDYIRVTLGVLVVEDNGPRPKQIMLQPRLNVLCTHGIGVLRLM